MIDANNSDLWSCVFVLTTRLFLSLSKQVPPLPRDRVTALDAADQLRLEGEREAALAAEAEQRKVGAR